MKEVLLNILKSIDDQNAFIARLAADVSAMKTVVSALDPRIAQALEAQVSVERDRFQKVFESHRQESEKLWQLVSQLPSEPTKPN